MLPVYGGQGYGVQLSALRRGVHVVVGTPGRVMDRLQDGKPLLLGEAPEPPKPERQRPREPTLDGHVPDRGGQAAPRRAAEDRRRPGERGRPGRADFGRIDIRPIHSPVELPADLPAATFERLADTKISGMLIDLRPDRGAGRWTQARRRPADRRHDGDCQKNGVRGPA